MINAYCVDEITIWKWNGTDSWNEPLSGTAVTVRGYVEWKTHLVRDIKGELVNSDVMIYLPRKIEKAGFLNRALCHEDRIQIGGESFERSIITIHFPKHFSDPHYEVYLT